MRHVVAGLAMLGAVSLPVMVMYLVQPDDQWPALLIGTAFFLLPFAALAALRRWYPPLQHLAWPGMGLWVPILAATGVAIGAREWIILLGQLTGSHSQRTVYFYDGVTPFLLAGAVVVGGAGTSWAAQTGRAGQLQCAVAYLLTGAAVIALWRVASEAAFHWSPLLEEEVYWLVGRSPVALAVAGVLNAVLLRRLMALTAWTVAFVVAILCEFVLAVPTLLAGLPCVPLAQPCLSLAASQLSPLLGTVPVVAAAAGAATFHAARAATR